MENLLSHNSETMATVVETFVIEETAELIYDGEALENWNNLVSELGLKGQTEIIHPDKSPIPFMHLKEGLINVFKTLCPRALSVENYNITPIPLEILKLIALSKQENYFNKIEIWYDDKNPDPVCVGMTGHYYQSTWGNDRNKELDNKHFNSEQDCKDAGATGSIYFSTKATYLIGKWADVKQSFEELKERAFKRYVEEQGAQYKKQIKESQRQLDDLENNAISRFN